MWLVNPTENVEATLRAIEEKAKERGIDTISEAGWGTRSEFTDAVVERVSGKREAWSALGSGTG